MTLDGSASSDSDGDALKYVWTGPFPEGGGTVTGATPSVTLPLGTSVVSLVVNDGSVDSPPDTATVTVAVDVQGFQPPFGALVPEGQTPAPPDAAFRKGRTIPLRLRIGCGGTALCAPGISPPQVAGIALGGAALDIDVLDLDAEAANDSGVDFRLSDVLWIYNLDTRGLAPGMYTIVVRMPDQSRWVGAFALR